MEFDAGPEFFPRALLRFDGIESAGTVWLNGTRLGTTRGSRLAHEFDVTDVLVPGRNILAVRVAQFSAASYVEDQDMWWLPGIFRDVTLQARPDNGIDDVFVHAGYDHLTGEGTPQAWRRPGPARRLTPSYAFPELDLELAAGTEQRHPGGPPVVRRTAATVRGHRQHRRRDREPSASASAASPSRTPSSRSTVSGSCSAA